MTYDELIEHAEDLLDSATFEYAKVQLDMPDNLEPMEALRLVEIQSSLATACINLAKLK